MAHHFRRFAFNANVAGDGERGEVDGGDGTPFFVGDEGMAFEPISLLPGAG